MGWKIDVDEIIKRDLEKALKNFDLFLDVCKKQNIKVTKRDKEVIIQMITTMAENFFEIIDTPDNNPLDFYIDNSGMLGVEDRKGTRYDFISHPTKFLRNLRKDIKKGLLKYLNLLSSHKIEVKWEDT